MDYSKMSDVDMSREVAKALKLPWSWNGGKTIFVADDTAIGRHSFDPCNNPADAWPIIVENRLYIDPIFVSDWAISSECDSFRQIHKNPLRAAMIVFLQMQESANVPANSTGSDLR